jgi:DNA-binding transcriptional LysR family regulator
MELRQLRYFVTVAEELHFARAAERLHIAQQSLSFQIKQLEQELGTALFERTTRHVELTAAGHAFLKEIEIVFEHLQKAAEQARKAGRGEAGRLVVGYHSMTLYNIMPSTIRRFRERFPDVELVLQEIIQPALEEYILSGEVDTGLAGFSGREVAGLAYAILYRDTVAVPMDSAGQRILCHVFARPPQTRFRSDHCPLPALWLQSAHCPRSCNRVGDHQSCGERHRHCDCGEELAACTDGRGAVPQAC